ncbi:nose resistant to fluoxetine protein 6 [Nephila pilipes]|uniref:Nose resistant to fluoxetine protein 6 n=1 Tax=Nephila pilipes TaxID=299642 RepID=A0A8X6QVB3_NEPPI|nr:nose resistant to fluoxetine protein 6 [Nephila pilipes]
MGENQKAKTAIARFFVYNVFFLLITQANSIAAKSTLFGNLTAPYLTFLDDLFYNLERADEKISDSCKADTRKLINLAREDDINALKILDASGKASSGILEGAVYSIGYYSECINTFVQSEKRTLKSKYCLISFNASADSHQEEIPHASWQVLTQRSKPPTIGLCVPQSCTTEDIQHATTYSLHNNFDDIDGRVTICHGDHTGFRTDVGAIVTLCILMFFIVLGIIGTTRDFMLTYKKTREAAHTVSDHSAEPNKNVSTIELCQREESRDPSLVDCYFLAFSFRTNAKKLFTLPKGGNISSIDGLKFLSMALIILGHTFSFGTQNLYFSNQEAIQQAPKDFLSQILANGTLAVDTFFVISGLLVTYVTLKLLAKSKGKVNWIYFYIHRYLRLTPLMMFVVLFCAYLLPYVSSGPNWPNSIEMYDQWCRKNGWLNALYLHNFINTENMCLSHTWYLATDMQMYIIVPIILFPLYKYYKIGVIIMVMVLAATTLTTALITAINNYPAIPYISNIVPLNKMNEYYKNVYIKPYCRMGPYIVGIGIAYLLLHHKELDLKKRIVALLWCLSTAAGLTVIYLMWPANKGILPTAAEAAAYSALARTVWGLCIGWVIISCYYGYGGFINSILSWSVFAPLSRLTYCAYLIHPVVMNVYYGSTESAIVFSQSYMIYTFLGNLTITYAISIICSLLFESPIIGLEKIFYKKSS